MQPHRLPGVGKVEDGDGEDGGCIHGHYGEVWVVEEIVTDIGSVMVAAVEWLTKTYSITHIRISPYNLQANGAVKTAHRHIQDMLIKVCNGNLTKWDQHVTCVFWAEGITTLC